MATSINNAKSIGALATEQQALRAELAMTKHVAARAIQLCNDLAARIPCPE